MPDVFTSESGFRRRQLAWFVEDEPILALNTLTSPVFQLHTFAPDPVPLGGSRVIPHHPEADVWELQIKELDGAVATPPQLVTFSGLSVAGLVATQTINPIVGAGAANALTLQPAIFPFWQFQIENLDAGNAISINLVIRLRPF